MRKPFVSTSFLLLTVLGAGLLASACATSSEAEAPPPRAAATHETCAACMAAQCPATYAGCVGEEQCKETFACVEKCAAGNKQCVWDCMLERPYSASQMFAAGECGTLHCKESCTLPDGVIDSCPVCSAKFCPNEINTCFTNRECWGLVACIRETCKTGELECAQGCIGKYPGGLAEIQALRDCSGDHCVAACAQNK